MPISAAIALIGCSGTDPNFIYNPAQADKVTQEVTDLTLQPIQKALSGLEITDSDKQKLAESLPLIDQLIQFDPVTINSYALKGKVLSALGHTEEAKLAYLTGIARSLPRDDETSTLVRSDVYAELAKIHYIEKDYASAESAAKSAIAIEDTSAAPHVLLGRVYQATDRIQDAKDEALRALLIDADFEAARILFRDLNPAPKPRN